MDRTERRQALLHAARDVFATKGYHDAKVDDIVARAKVAKGTFYLYFPDKRSVFSQLLDLVFQRLQSAILKVDPATDVDSQVQHNIRAIVGVLLDDPALTRILISDATGMDPEFVAKMRAFYDGVKAMLEESLVDGQQLGIVAAGNARLYATFTVGALKELLVENLDRTDVLPKEAREAIVRSVFTFLEGGYLRTKPSREAPAIVAAPVVVPEPKPEKRRRRASSAR